MNAPAIKQKACTRCNRGGHMCFVCGIAAAQIIEPSTLFSNDFGAICTKCVIDLGFKIKNQRERQREKDRDGTF